MVSESASITDDYGKHALGDPPLRGRIRCARGRWDALASATDAGLFLSHRWLSAWWRAFHGVDELWVFTVEDDAGALTPAWPLCLRAPQSGALRVGELRVIGDLGGAAASDRSILCIPGQETAACAALVEALLAAKGWTCSTCRRRGASSARRWRARWWRRARSSIAPSRRGARSSTCRARSKWNEFARTRGRSARSAAPSTRPPRSTLSHGLEELLRLLRKEWAAREATSPAADPQAVAFLHEMVPALHGEEGLLRLGHRRRRRAGRHRRRSRGDRPTARCSFCAAPIPSISRRACRSS